MWPSSLPIIGRPWVDATAVDAKVRCMSWMQSSFTAARADALLEGLEIAQALPRLGAGDDPRVAGDAMGVAEQIDGGLAEMDDLGAGL